MLNFENHLKVGFMYDYLNVNITTLNGISFDL